MWLSGSREMATMGWKIRLPAGYRRLVLLLLALVGAGAILLLPIGSSLFLRAAVAEMPHGDYLSDTPFCASCHFGHTSLSFPLLEGQTQRETCYRCHDGSVSIYDTRGAFGESTIGSTTKPSVHPVPQGSLLCTDCHEPHFSPLDTPRLLHTGAEGISSGNAVCGACHGQGSTLPGGNMLANFMGTAHDTKLNPPPSGTGIKCVRCHQPHGANAGPLLRDEITDDSGKTTTVTGNDNSVCFSCHYSSSGKYSGQTVYNQTAHAITPASTTALTSWPGKDYAGGQCTNCHDPHGTGNATYLRQAGNGLCYNCHDAEFVSLPSAYSYRGQAVYQQTEHATATTPATSFTYTSASAGFQAWEAGGASEPTPASPGTQLPEASSLAAQDGNRQVTDLAAADGQYNYQLYRFLLRQTSPDILKLDARWVGYGEPTPNYPVSFSIWDFEAAAWEQLASAQLSSEGVLSGSRTDASKYVGPQGEVYLMARAKHDGIPPVVTNQKVTINSGSQVTVTWTTNEPATSFVDYGPTAAYGYTVGDAALTTSHTVTITGLSPQDYHYRIRTADALGNEYVSGDGVFHPSNPPPAPVLVPEPDYNDGLESITVTLEWNPVTDPDGDQVQYYAEISPGWGGSASPSSSGWITGTSWTTTITNWDTVTYTWRVKARDNYGVESSWASDSFNHTGPSGGSCPFIYIWDGEKYSYVTDIQGQVLGVGRGYARNKGVRLYGPSYVPLAGFKPEGDKYRLKVREVITEVDYFDEAKLVFVDHPPGYEIYSSTAENGYYYGMKKPLKFYAIKDARLPLKATDKEGRDILAALSRVDNVTPPTSNGAVEEFVLDFGRIKHPERAKLVIDGWTVLGKLADKGEVKAEEEYAPYIEVINAKGEWEKVKSFGLPAGDLKTMVIELGDIFPTADQRIRINTGWRNRAEMLIDRIRLDESEPVELKVSEEVGASKAELRHGGRVTFSYTTLEHRIKAADDHLPANPNSQFSGRFTRYGEVTPLLAEADDMFVIMRHGDELEMEFPAGKGPGEGLERTVFLKADVYYKTASAGAPREVDPLPFHGMSSYPYPEDEKYPDDPAHRQYLQVWNTRIYEGAGDDGDHGKGSDGDWLGRGTVFLRRMGSYAASFWMDLGTRLQAWFAARASMGLESAWASWLAGAARNASLSADPDGERHYSLNTDYVELRVVASGGVPSGSCLMCHNPHGQDTGHGEPYAKQLVAENEETCFSVSDTACHSTVNSAKGINIKERFTLGANLLNRHSVTTSEQQVGGTRVECTNCHNPHLNTAGAKIVDPDDHSLTYTYPGRADIDRRIGSNGEVYVLVRAKHDGIPPVVTNQKVTVNSGSQVTVTWTTNEPATSFVDYTLTQYVYEGVVQYVYGGTAGNASLVSSHSVVITGLSPQDYYYRIRTADALGNEYVSGDGIFHPSNPPPAPVLVPEPDYNDGLESITVTLEWNPVTDPDGDQVQYYAEISPGWGGSASPSSSGWITGTSWTTTITNWDTVTYTWRVKARDNYGVESSWASDSFNHTGPSGGSCPFIYIWDGEKYSYVTDIQGQVLGVGRGYARNKGVRLYGPSYVPLAGFKPEGDKYRLKVREVITEVDYFDEAKLVFVDHPPGYEIYSSTAENGYYYGMKKPLKFYAIKDARLPLKATDKEGRDILAALSRVDNVTPPTSNGAVEEFVLDFGRIKHPERAKLVIDGWTVLGKLADKGEVKAEEEYAPYIEVINAKGEWEKVKSFGLPAGDLKTMVIELGDIFPTADQRIRINTGWRNRAEMLIDRIRLDESEPVELKVSEEVGASKAELRHGGRVTFSYTTLEHRIKAADDHLPANPNSQFSGRFTRYGEVTPLLAEADDMFVIMRHGDELEMEFPAGKGPGEGLERTVFLKADVYYKTASAGAPREVDPLPFHGMS
ncbi:MAG: hypothetical protein D9V47_10570, partial [Clostridia bacterium]